MDHPIPLFQKETRVVEDARDALAALGSSELAEPYSRLLAEYEALLGRSRAVAEMALMVQTDLEAAMDQVAQLTQVDGLTGALNRRAFERLLARDWAKAQREGSPVGLLVVDVDGFRPFNDVNGFPQGDDCRKGVAQAVMRSLYREVDAAGRRDADTFAALLPGTDVKGALLVAGRIVSEVAALEIPHLESPHGGVVTVSVGVAVASPTRADAPMGLVREAQAALGRAKDQGGNTVALHEDGPAA